MALPLIAVSRVCLFWVESGRLAHVPEVFVTAHYTGATTIRAKREGHRDLAGRRILGKLGSYVHRRLTYNDRTVVVHPKTNRRFPKLRN